MQVIIIFPPTSDWAFTPVNWPSFSFGATPADGSEKWVTNFLYRSNQEQNATTVLRGVGNSRQLTYGEGLNSTQISGQNYMTVTENFKWNVLLHIFYAVKNHSQCATFASSSPPVLRPAMNTGNPQCWITYAMRIQIFWYVTVCD